MLLETPHRHLGFEDVDRTRLSKLVRSAFQPQTTHEMPPASVRELASRFRVYCAEYGPDRVLAEIGAAQEVDAENLRLVAYLFAHKVARDDAIELCVEQGIFGFQEWLEARRV